MSGGGLQHARGMTVSQNGWPVLEHHQTFQWVIPHTGRHLVLAPGAPGFLLAHFASWFHHQVEQLDTGQWDEWGWASRPIRGSSSVTSNHASGTAIDLNAQAHPLGSRNTFTDEQSARIRSRLRGTYGDTIRWGGDYKSRADEMHFELVSAHASVLRVARRVALRRRARLVLEGSGTDLTALRSR